MIRQIFHCIYCRIVADTGFIEQLMIIEIGIGFILHRSVDCREKTRSLLGLVCGCIGLRGIIDPIPAVILFCCLFPKGVDVCILLLLQTFLFQ